jgi:hypothetical protein
MGSAAGDLRNRRATSAMGPPKWGVYHSARNRGGPASASYMTERERVSPAGHRVVLEPTKVEVVERAHRQCHL